LGKKDMNRKEPTSRETVKKKKKSARNKKEKEKVWEGTCVREKGRIQRRKKDKPKK